MKPITAIFTVLFVLVPNAFAIGSALALCGLDFCYQPQSGQCLDMFGNEGRNKITPDEFKSTKNGECTDFQGATFSVDLSEGSSPGPYDEVNLRGANLNGAKLEQLYYKIAGSFEGADLTTFHFGYTVVEGETDMHTKLPSYCVPQVKIDLPEGVFWISCLH